MLNLHTSIPIRHDLSYAAFSPFCVKARQCPLRKTDLYWMARSFALLFGHFFEGFRLSELIIA